MPDGGGAPGIALDAKRSWLQRYLGFSFSAPAAGMDQTRLDEVKKVLDKIEAEVAASATAPNYQNLSAIKANLSSPASPVLKGLQGNASPEAPAQSQRVVRLIAAASDLLFKADLADADTLMEKLPRRVAETATQPVGEKVRLLTSYKTQLSVPPISKVESGKGTAADALKTKITALDGEITTLIANARAAALAAIKAHMAEWSGKMTAALTAPAAAKLATLNEVEKGLVDDGGLAQRLGIDVGGIAAALQRQVDALRQSYKDAIPTRRSTGAPGKADEVKKPLLGTAAVPADLERLLADSEGKMSKGEKPDPDAVRQQVEMIKAGGFCATAEENMKELGSWEAAKTKYKQMTPPEAAKKFMAELWWYRRQLVDGTMLALQDKYDFAWGSVGSANLESDYDVTVRTHGKSIPDPKSTTTPPATKPCRYDYEIVQEFNDILSGMFKGAAPGIVFDTNLYAEAVPEENPAGEASPIANDMKAMRESGQDVGALMKLRRFMDEEEYQTYMEGVLEPLKADPAAYKTTKNQFEEADANYQIARLAQLDATAGAGNPNQLPASDAPARGAIAQQYDTVHAGEGLDANGPQAMATNNKLYLEALAEARKIEEKLVRAESPADKDALFTQLKGIQARATFFAAEAYHSEGPLKHVVQAAQSSRVAVNSSPEYQGLDDRAKDAKIAELTTAAMQKLTPTQLLQSFNENNGDLLKDIKHYEHASPFPGLGFYRCSKYLERICDAAEWIAKNLKEKAQQDAIMALKIGEKTPAEVKRGVVNLVSIRGGKKEFKSPDGAFDPEAEKEAYAVAEMADLFPTVKTLRDLAGIANAYSSKVNSLVRSWEAKNMQAKNTAAFFAAGA